MGAASGGSAIIVQRSNPQILAAFMSNKPTRARAVSSAIRLAWALMPHELWPAC